MDRTLFIFPGQGSQYPGIGEDLYAASESAREIYQIADETLGFSVSELSFKDVNDEINLTRNTQPVLLTHSMACLAAFNEALGTKDTVPALSAGHSLGEYGALTVAGVLAFPEALALVRKRGELMGSLGDGEMLAVPMVREELDELAHKHYCAIAGINLVDQTVIGGAGEDLDRLALALKETHPRKRATRLKTEGAFHTYYMVAAAQQFRTHLDQANFASMRCKVLSNFNGSFHDSDPNGIRSRLFWQLFHPVLWHSNLMSAKEHGIDRVIEFGGGIGRGETAGEKRPNLEGIIKKAFRNEDTSPEYLSVINCKTLEETINALGS